MTKVQDSGRIHGIWWKDTKMGMTWNRYRVKTCTDRNIGMNRSIDVYYKTRKMEWRWKENNIYYHLSQKVKQRKEGNEGKTKKSWEEKTWRRWDRRGNGTSIHTQRIICVSSTICQSWTIQDNYSIESHVNAISLFKKWLNRSPKGSRFVSSCGHQIQSCVLPHNGESAVRIHVGSLLECRPSL